MEFKDYYAALGVTKSSTEKEIKQAFRKLARKHHPDVNPGDKAAEAKFKEINEAYEVLGDPAKRKKYDELGANWRAYEQAERAGGPNPFAGQWNANAKIDPLFANLREAASKHENPLEGLKLTAMLASAVAVALQNMKTRLRD